MVGLCNTDCCAVPSVGTWVASGIGVNAGGTCMDVIGAGGAAICLVPLSGGADVYTVVKSAVNLTSRSAVMLQALGQ